MEQLFKNKKYTYYIYFLIFLCLQQLYLKDPFYRINVLISLPENLFKLAICAGNIILISMHYIYNIYAYILLKDFVQVRCADRFQKMLNKQIIISFVEVLIPLEFILLYNHASNAICLKMVGIEVIEMFVFMLYTYIFKKKNFGFILTLNIITMLLVLSII